MNNVKWPRFFFAVPCLCASPGRFILLAELGNSNRGVSTKLTVRHVNLDDILKIVVNLIS